MLQVYQDNISGAENWGPHSVDSDHIVNREQDILGKENILITFHYYY